MGRTIKSLGTSSLVHFKNYFFKLINLKIKSILMNLNKSIWIQIISILNKAVNI